MGYEVTLRNNDDVFPISKAEQGSIVVAVQVGECYENVKPGDRLLKLDEFSYAKIGNGVIWSDTDDDGVTVRRLHPGEPIAPGVKTPGVKTPFPAGDLVQGDFGVIVSVFGETANSEVGEVMYRTDEGKLVNLADGVLMRDIDGYTVRDLRPGEEVVIKRVDD
jgi:hypothetical protein